jgi:acyl carrier protein
VLRGELPLSQPYVEPRTTTERKLADIWSSVLSMDCVGVDDSYHELGGDSFLAAIIFGLIEERIGVRLPMAILVSKPTVALLAADLDRSVEAG